MMKAPLTIVTVTYNAERFLARTLDSVAAAVRALPAGLRFQYLLMDGASTDGTLALARRYQEQLGLEIHSEKDKGLYDAMNKGLQIALGQYVWFLNAGDEIHDADVLVRLLQAMASRADIYYSDALFVSESGAPLGLRSRITPHALSDTLTWKDMAMGMKICHQAFIVKTALAPLYDTANLSADLDWEIEAMKRATSICYLDFVLCKYLTGGLSTQRHRESLSDRWRVLRRHFGTAGALVSHLRILLRGLTFMVKHGKYW